MEVPRFILDVHLGKLAAYLRMLGFDTLYRNDAADEALACESSMQKRILLTFDRELLHRKNIVYGYYVRSRDPFEQLIEISERFDLLGKMKPFTRCMLCNGEMQPVDDEKRLEQVSGYIRSTYDEFHICDSCHQIYWRGTHFDRMEILIQRLKDTLVD